jgi:hypothetical protein
MRSARLLALPLMLAFAGCDGTSLDFWLERQFTVDVPAGEVTTFAQTKAVDLRDVNKKQPVGSVKEILVPEVWVELSNVTQPATPTTFSGTVAMGATEDGEFITLAEFSGISVAEGEKKQVLLDAEAQKRAQPILLGRDSAFVKYTATASSAPVKFDVKARIHLAVTVGL